MLFELCLVTGKGDSPKVAAVLSEVKRIKVSPKKSGRLYPSLTDIESVTETEVESPTPNDNSRCDKITDWILFVLCLS